jgi:hypothetical protein
VELPEGTPPTLAELGMEKNTGAKGIGTSVVLVWNHTPPTLAELGMEKNKGAKGSKCKQFTSSPVEPVKDATPTLTELG